MKKAILIALVLIIFVQLAFAVSYKVVRTDHSVAFGYSSEIRQTDNDPSSTASGTKCHWGTVAANHLPLWTRLKIEGFGEKIFTVEDRHSKRFKKIIDIWFPKKSEAQRFGKKHLQYWIVKNVAPNS